MIIPNILFHAIPFAVFIIAIEWLLVYCLKRQTFDLKDSVNSIILGIVKIGISLLTKSFSVSIFYLIYENYRFITLKNTIFLWIFTFIATDFTYYWFHRVSHKVRWFWASHVTHHSSHEFNLLVGIRHGWTSNFTGALIFYIWLPFFGFPPVLVFSTMQLNFIYTYCVHTELIKKLWSPIEFIFVTPSHHRVHHASNDIYINANYGEVLILWDRFFGTFVEEQEQPIYGLVRPIRTNNPLILAFHEWVAMGHDIGRARSFKHILMFLFASPGWRPVVDNKLRKQIKIKEK